MPIRGLPLTDSQLFDCLNIVMPAWLLLAVAPRWRFTNVVAVGCALLVSALYVALMVPQIVFPEDKMDFKEFFNLQASGAEPRPL